MSKMLKLIYLMISLVLIYAEYLNDPCFLYFIKPLLMPTLFFLYLVNTDKKKINGYFVLSLFFMWIANVCFISPDRTMFILGAFNTFLSRLFVLILILKCYRIPKPLPFLIATFPFLIIFITVLQLVGESLGQTFYFYIINGILVIVLGGVALANHFVSSGRVNTYILISIILFTCMQFVVAVDYYYLSLKIFRPIAIVVFSVAQYIFYMAMITMNQTNEEKLNDDTSSVT